MIVCYLRTEKYGCLEDLVRVVVREFPLVSANVGKLPVDLVREVDYEVTLLATRHDSGLCFCPVLFPFFLGWLVYAVKVAGMVVHLGDLVLRREMTQALAGGCHANNVRQ